MAARKKKKEKAAKGDPAGQGKTISHNRKATHRYEILEKIECGIVLKGSEVKSLREGQLSLDEAYVRIRDNEIWLIGADIPEYKQATIWNHAPRRPRKLLVHGRQYKKLAERAFEKGLSLIPLHVYFNARGIVKVMVGVGKGKKLHDKRESMKKADVKRQINRAMRRK